jgi:MurNAc alpha-1-phosphate uridylyltransferase
LGIRKIIINTFYLGDQIANFLKKKNFISKIKIIDEGENILDTGGGILNMINHSNENNFLVFNPDTLWHKDYLDEIVKMEELYYSKKVQNILLLANKNLSFDKNLNGDFSLENDLISKGDKNYFIYTGCQILSKKIFINYKVENFSITRVWNGLIEKKELFGFESNNDFYHLTDLKTFKKLQDL